MKGLQTTTKQQHGKGRAQGMQAQRGVGLWCRKRWRSARKPIRTRPGKKLVRMELIKGLQHGGGQGARRYRVRGQYTSTGCAIQGIRQDGRGASRRTGAEGLTGQRRRGTEGQ